MFEKLKERVIKYRYNLYHKVANYCFRKVDEYGPEVNDFWMHLCEKYTRKEFEMFGKLYGEGTHN